MRQLITLCLTFVLSVAFNTVSAQTTATVNKNQVTQNEVFQLTISTDQDVDRDSVNFDILNKYFLVSQPNFSNSVNIINGNRTNKSKWTITLTTNKLGVVTIPRFTIHGEHTQPIAIQVIRDNYSPHTSDLVQIHTRIENTTLYPNESTLMHVQLTIKADTRQMQNPQITPPSAQGVNLEAASKPDQTQHVINGINTTILSQDFRITATKSGQYTVTEPQFHSSMYYRDIRGNTKLIPLITQPKTFNIQVMTKPKGYHGIWLPTSSLHLTEEWLGSQNQSLKQSPIILNVGDSLTRIIHLTVRGVSQERIPDIHLNYPENLRVYPEKPNYKTLSNGDLEMTLKQVIIASNPGKYTLPNVAVNWWNTTIQKQRKSLLSSKLLEVKGSLSTSPAVQSVLPIPPKSPATKIQTKIVYDSGYWPYLTALFAILWGLTTIIFMIRKKTIISDAVNSSNSESESESEKSIPTINALETAITKRDGINIQRYYVIWKDEHNYSNDNEIKVLDDEISNLLSKLYAKNPEEYQSKTLITRLRKANNISKSNKKRTEKSFKLPKL